MLNLTENAKIVLEARYLMRDSKGQFLETPEGLFARVARHIAKGDATFEAPFLEMLTNLEFLPNTPTLANAGTKLGQLAACFVLPVEDSLEDIFESLKLMALVQQSGGGTGFSFTHLRQKGSVLSRSGGVSSGPVSFMKIFDTATENIRQGGRRRGANMGVLNIDHPDILEFIDAKLDGKSLQNFNISVGMTDTFMKSLGTSAHSQKLFEKICLSAWRTGDPGLIFLDAIHRKNPLPSLGPIEATNPCGEVPLLPYEACTLGSINLTKVWDKQSKKVNWEKLKKLTRLGIRFLDNVVENNEPPSPKIKAMIQANRKLGLGVMGFADLNILMEIPYGSSKSVALAKEIMKTIEEEAWATSEELAEERGVFTNWERSIFAKQNRKVRNATCTSIAPTGTISLIANCSSGIEPLFALAHRRNALDGKVLVDFNEAFQKTFQKQPKVLEQVAKSGTLTGIKEIPESIRELYKTALELSPEEHLGIQVAFQEHTDNAVSKTINLPESATVEVVREIYQQAWERQLKGVTLFRYGSKEAQVLELGSTKCEPDECKL